MRFGVLAATVLLMTTPAAAEEVTVFAAASLGDVLADAGEAWGAETGHSVTLVAAGSSVLARQVAAGAGADLVIPASSDWMDWMQARGLILEETRRDVMGNALVLVGHGPGEASTAPVGPEGIGLPGGGRLAVALTDAVPAGQYARAALEALGLWDGLKDRLAEADNVRAALTFVALGAAPMGVVYATDARAEPRVHVLGVFPAESHPPIRYPGAVATAADAPDAALGFLDWLGSADGRDILEGHGFVLLPE